MHHSITALIALYGSKVLAVVSTVVVFGMLTYSGLQLLLADPAWHPYRLSDRAGKGRSGILHEGRLRQKQSDGFNLPVG